MSTLMLPLLIFTFWFSHHLGADVSSVDQPRQFELGSGSIEGDYARSALAELAQNGPPALAQADGGVNSTDVSAASAAAISKNSSGSMTPSRSKQLLSLDPGSKIDPEFTKLAMKRYSHDEEDETLFVAQRDTKTDYREPPGAGYYPGVLNTGRRRYGHPAITGILPELWLPIPAHRIEEGGEEVTAPMIWKDRHVWLAPPPPRSASHVAEKTKAKDRSAKLKRLLESAHERCPKRNLLYFLSANARAASCPLAPHPVLLPLKAPKRIVSNSKTTLTAQVTIALQRLRTLVFGATAFLDLREVHLRRLWVRR